MKRLVYFATAFQTHEENNNSQHSDDNVFSFSSSNFVKQNIFSWELPAGQGTLCRDELSSFF